MISSESLNLLQSNLLWWCIIMSQIVFQKDWFEVLKVKVTVRDIMVKIWLSNISSELLIFLQLNLGWWHIIISWIVLWNDWIALLWSRSRAQEELKIPVNIHVDDDCWTFCNQTLNGDKSMGQSVMQEDWFAVFKFKVTMRAHVIRYDRFYHICGTAYLSANQM